MGSNEYENCGSHGASSTVKAAGWVACSLILGAACGTPRVGGVAGVSPSPGVAWTPPHDRATARDSLALPAVPGDLEQRIRKLSLSDVVAIGLRNNPATRLS